MNVLRILLFALALAVGQAHAADPCAIAGRCAPVPPTIVEEPISLSRVLLFREQHRGGRYERTQHEQAVIGSAALRFSIHDIAAGGRLITLPAGSYALIVDDRERARIDVTGGTVAQFMMVEAEHRPGWRRVRVQEPSGVLSPTWFVHVGATHIDNRAPLVTSVFDWTHGAKPVHRWAWIPLTAAPARYPIAIRDWPHFATALPGKDLHLSTLMPDTGYRLIRGDGYRSTFNEQAYYYSSLVRKLPVHALLDGPPGVGTMVFPTHIEMGRATTTADPASRAVRAAYVLNPWALARINEDGTKRTLVGYRGWPGALELVGNWEAVPAERRGLHEAWSIRFKPSSLAVDLTAPLINGRPPHSGNPVAFIADTQNDRVLEVTADGKSHDTPWKVREFIVGIKDPFGLVVWRNELIVSERLAHRIAAYDADTGAFKRVVLQCDGTNYSMGRDREPIRFASAALEAAALAKRRAAPCVAPEGLDLDGDELVIGSVAQAQIRRLNLVSGVLRVQGNVQVDAGSNFVVVAANDGSFGPPGTVFAATWSGTQFGYPIAILPSGARWFYMSNSQAAPSVGRGPLWTSFGYSAAVGVRDGRLVFGSTDAGLRQIGRAAANDAIIDLKRYNTGLVEMDHLLWADGGFSPYGYEAPRSANIDYYLQVHGQR